MGLLDLFKSCIISALNRSYLLDRWIGDESLVTILQTDYSLEFVNKRYINRYLPNLHIKDIKSYNIRINAIKKNDNRLTNVLFYHFSKSTISPKHLSIKLEWQQVYNNFRILCSPTYNNNKRNKLHDISNTTIEILEDDNDQEIPREKKIN